MSTFLKNFFYADIYRLLALIICIFDHFLVIPILIIVFGARRKFSSLFIIMLNLIIIGLINTTSYNLDWVIKEEGEEDKLLFGGENYDFFLCKLQALLINYTIMVRETLVLCLMLSIHLMIGNKMNISRNSRWFKYNFLICYGIPLIITLCELPMNVFGKSDRFCYMKNYLENKESQISSKIAACIIYIYLAIIIILDILLTVKIIYEINKEDNDECYEDKNNNYKNQEMEKVISDNASRKSCCNNYITKILAFPVLQVCLHISGLVYRLMDLFSISGGSKYAGITALSIMSPGFCYALAFAITNNLSYDIMSFYLCRRKINNNDKNIEKEIDESFEDSTDRSKSVNQLDVTN